MKKRLISSAVLFALLLCSTFVANAQTATAIDTTKPLSGTYSLGYDDSADFNSLADAIRILRRCGVSGPVQILIDNGTYSQFNITGSIPGSSAKNLVTFRSASGVRDSVRIYDTRAILLINTAHLRIESMCLDGIVVGVELDSTLDDIVFHNCNITAPVSNNYIYRAVSYVGNATSLAKKVVDVRFIGNTISGGYSNFYLNNSSNSTDFEDTSVAGFTIDSNVMEGAYTYGLYFYQTGKIRSFSHNTITNPNPSLSFYGVYSNGGKHWGRIDGNRVHIKSKKDSYGFYFSASHNAKSKQPAIICNNEIILSDSNKKYGIYLYNPGGPWEVTNNSILTHSITTSYGLYMYTSYSDRKSVVCNNIFVNGKNNGCPVYIMSNTNSTYYQRDYNNYYSGGTFVAYIGSSKKSLQEVQVVDTLLDQHSVSIAPVWVDSSRTLDVRNKSSYVCLLQPGVNIDINGLQRSLRTEMGCYGKKTDSINACLTGFADMEKIVASAASPVKVVLSNAGKASISSATITLWIDNVKKVDFKYSPSKPLQFQQIDTVNLGSFQFTAGNHDFLACVKMAGDTDASNDTITYRRYVCNGTANGTFVIGNSKSADYSYADMDKLFTRLRDCGAGSDITIAFEDGTYRGGLDITPIADAMGKHRLILTSVSKDRTKVTLADSGHFALKIGRGNKNVIVEHLGFFGMADMNNPLVWLTGCSDVIVRNSLMRMDTNCSNGLLLSAERTDGIVKNVRITHNMMQGGSYAVSINGNSATDPFLNIIVDSNEMVSQRTGISISYANVTSISHNRMLSRRPTKNPVNYTGLFFSNGIVDSIVGNYIDGLRDTKNQLSGRGMYFNNMMAADSSCTFVANNCVLTKIAGTTYAVQLIVSSVQFYHNTVRATAITNNTSYCLHINRGIGGLEQRICGNIFDASKAEGAIYINSLSGTKPCFTDYNDYSNVDGLRLASINGVSCNDIAGIMAASKADSHSVSVTPIYLDMTKDLKVIPVSQLLMPRLNEVKTDINGKARPVNTLMGAFESDAEKNDASLSDFSKTDLVKGSSSPVYVTLANMGSGNLTSVTIRWTFNGVAQTAVNWKGNLPYRGVAAVQLGSIVPSSSNKLVAWVEKPNSQNDANHSNDTVFYSKYICSGPIAGGSYTLGGYNPTYADEEELVNALYNCGITGPVTITIRTGKYGQLNLPDSIPGSSSKNTVTFKAAKGDSPVFDGGSGKPGLFARNLKYVTFQELTFGNTTDGLAGVDMAGSCSHVTFRGCNIYACATCTTNLYKAFSYTRKDNISYPVEVRLVGNRIVGGYYGLYLNQIAGATGNIKLSSVYIDSNELADAYYYGMYVYYYGNFPSISHNSIRSRTGLKNTHYGAYISYYVTIGKMEGNRFLTNASMGYGLYLANYVNHANYSSHSAMITNNEIMVIGSNAQYGLSLSASSCRLDIHHNSIYVKSDSGAAYGFNFTPSSSASYKTNFTRNLISVNGISNYPICIRSANYGSSYGLREWNVFYSKDNVAYLYTATANKYLTTIAELQAVTGQDSNSLKRLPSFADLDKGLDLKDYNSLLCSRVDSVRTDISGHQRNASTTIGCYATSVYSDEYKLKVSSNSNSMGAVAGGGTYSGGTRVKITANATAHHHFLHWNDGNRENPRYILIWKDTSFTATFAPDTHMVTLHSNDTNMGTVTGDGPYAYGATATLKADAKPDHHFKQWSDGNKQNPRQLTVTKDVELTAFFEQGDAIREVEAQRLTIYPNPVGKALFITNGERFDGTAYEVADMTGRLVLRGSYNASEGINVEELADGIYLLRIGNVTGRFVK